YIEFYMNNMCIILYYSTYASIYFFFLFCLCFVFPLIDIFYLVDLLLGKWMVRNLLDSIMVALKVIDLKAQFATHLLIFLRHPYQIHTLYFQFLYFRNMTCFL